MGVSWGCVKMLCHREFSMTHRATQNLQCVDMYTESNVSKHVSWHFQGCVTQNLRLTHQKIKWLLLLGICMCHAICLSVSLSMLQVIDFIGVLGCFMVCQNTIPRAP